MFDALGRFFLMPPIAIGVALLPLVARWRGAGVEPAALQREIRLALVVAAVYAVVAVGPLCYVAIDLVVPYLVDEPTSRAWAAQGLLWLPAAVLVNVTLVPIRLPRRQLTW